MKSSAKKVELASVDDLFTTEESRADAGREKVVEIPLSELHSFKGHPFKVKDDDAMMETADSIRQYGVLVPAIARPAPSGGYELVAGHRRHTYKDDSQNHFVCSNYKSNTGSCQIHYIREVTLYKKVLECIQGTLSYVQLFRDDFTQEMLAQDEASRKAELTQKRKALSGAQKRMEDLDKIIQRLYEDSVLGKLSDLRFQKLSAQYETEQAEIQRLASSLEQEIENETEQIADVGRFLQLADRYSDLQELDASTVNELIDRIVIYSPERIGGRKHVTIEIYFTYVGKIRIPLYKPDIPASTEKPA